MADIAIAPRRAKTEIREASAWDQLKHNRNWLGFWFMLPAMAFLIFFLAYPLGLGIWISFRTPRTGGRGVLTGGGNSGGCGAVWSSWCRGLIPFLSGRFGSPPNSRGGSIWRWC